MSGMMSVSGLISGLDTEDIISKIMEFARRPQTQLENKKTAYQQSLVAWQDINTRVLAVQNKVRAIADAADFRASSVSSSNSDILTASASTTAATGTYYVTVVSRAQNHQVASQSGAYTTVNDVVGTGEVEIELENGTSFKVTLDSSNNTLTGLKDAINKADGGVQATIINTGSSSDPDYQLLLTSTSAGESNSMTSVDTSGLSGGTAPVFNLVDPVQAAAPAQIEIGQGAGKITVYKDTNSISDLIPGVTLNLLSEEPGTTVRIDIARDTTTIKQAIEGFVAQYNDLSDAIDEQFDYDTETGASGALFGDSRLRSVHSDLVSTLTNAVEGLTGDLRALSSLGITQDTGGHLVINDEELSVALEENIDQVSRVFSAGTDSGSSYVSYLSSTAETEPSGSAGWQVEVTQAASRAQLTAGVEISDTLLNDETLIINGEQILLEAGMDIDDVVDKINSYTSDTDVVAFKTGSDGTGSGNYLTFRQVKFGSRSKVEAVSSVSSLASPGRSSGIGLEQVTSSDWVGESGGSGAAGLDIAGKINGATATGNGQSLTLDGKDVANSAKGLSLFVTATAPMTTKVTYTKGAGAALRELITDMTSADGSITTAEASLNDAIDEVTENIADMEERLAAQEARLYTQFNNMESQLAKLQDQGNYLTSMLSSSSNSD